MPVLFDDQVAPKPLKKTTKSKVKVLLVIGMFGLLPLTLLLLSKPALFFPKASEEAQRVVNFTSPIRVNRTTANSQNFATSGVANDGTLHVVWRSEKGGSDNGDVYYASSKDGLENWDGENKLNKETIEGSPDLPKPSIAVGENEMVVVWSDGGSINKVSSKNGGDSWSEPELIKPVPEVFTEISINAWTPLTCFAETCPKASLYINGELVQVNGRDYVLIESQTPSAQVVFSGISYLATDRIDIYIDNFYSTHKPIIRKATIAGVETTAYVVDSGLMTDETALDCENVITLTGSSLTIESEAAIRFNHSCEGQPGYLEETGAAPLALALDPRVVYRDGVFRIITIEQLASSNRVVLYSSQEETAEWQSEIVAVDVVNDPALMSPALAVSGSKLHAVWVAEDSSQVSYAQRDLGGGSWSTSALEVQNGGTYGHPSVVVNSNKVFVAYTVKGSREIFVAQKGIDQESFTQLRVGPAGTPVEETALSADSDNVRVYWSGLKTGGSGSDNRSLFYAESLNEGLDFADEKEITPESGSQTDPFVSRDSGGVDHIVYTGSTEGNDVYYLSATTTTEEPARAGLVVKAKASYENEAEVPKFFVRVKFDVNSWYVGAESSSGERILTRVTNKDNFIEYVLPVEREVPENAEVDIVYFNDTSNSDLYIQSVGYRDADSQWEIPAVDSRVIFDRGEVEDTLGETWLGTVEEALNCADAVAGRELMNQDGALRFNSGCEPGEEEPVPFVGAINVRAKGVASKSGVMPKIKVAVDGVFSKDTEGKETEYVMTGDYGLYVFPLDKAPLATSKIDVLFSNSDLNLPIIDLKEKIVLMIDYVGIDNPGRSIGYKKIEVEDGVGSVAEMIVQDTGGSFAQEFASWGRQIIQAKELVYSPSYDCWVGNISACSEDAVTMFETGALRINYDSSIGCIEKSSGQSSGPIALGSYCTFLFDKPGTSDTACLGLGLDDLCQGEASPSAKPDLAMIDGMQIFRSKDPALQIPANAVEDKDLVVGEKVFLRVYLENKGASTTESRFRTEWTLVDGSKDSDLHPVLPAGAQSDYYYALVSDPWTWTVTPGDSTFSFRADADSQIDESDETNNSVTRTIHVQTDENNTCNKPNGLCIRAKAQIDHFPLQDGPPIFRLWVDGFPYRLPVSVDPLRHQLQQAVANESDWQVYEYDISNISQSSIVYISYINDRYDGTAQNDRNLIIDWVEIAGKRVVAEDAVYDIGRFVGDYRVWRGQHDQGKDCAQVIQGQKAMNVEGSLRFNDATCNTKMHLGTIRGRIFKSPTYGSDGKLLSPGTEVTSLDPDITVRLDYNLGSPLIHSYISPYFMNIWQGSHQVNLKVPSGWDVKYRVCVNDFKCHTEPTNPEYQNLKLGTTAGVDIPSTLPTTGEGTPYVDIYWFVTPK